MTGTTHESRFWRRRSRQNDPIAQRSYRPTILSSLVELIQHVAIPLPDFVAADLQRRRKLAVFDAEGFGGKCEFADAFDARHAAVRALHRFTDMFAEIGIGDQVGEVGRL